MKFFSHINNPNLLYLVQWTGTFLSDIKWLPSVHDLLACHNSIIIIEANEANFQIELTRQLIAQGNFMVFCDFFESQDVDVISNLLRDLGKVAAYATIGSCRYTNKLTFNLNEYFHSTLNWPNQLRAEHSLERIYGKVDKPYRFLYLNPWARRWRRQLWYRLSSRNLLDQALWSWTHPCEDMFDWDPHTEPSIPLTYLTRDYESVYADLDSLEAYKQDHRGLMRLPFDEFRGHWGWGHLVMTRMEDTYFTVYSESDITNQRYTDKLFNELLAGHPFIAIGSSDYYHGIKDMGFETFSPWIDESFANVKDVDRRLDAVAQEIQRLCSLDLDQWLAEVRPICEHNRNLYLDRQKTQWFETHQNLHRFFEQVWQAASRAAS